MMNNESLTLIATLGGQPQIVTLTLDLLLERGERIDQVVVVYLAGNPRYQQAFRRLGGEFPGDRYAGRSIHLRGAAVRRGSELPAEARTALEVEAVRVTFFDLLADLKRQGRRVHLSLSGGRRILALAAMGAAIQHLTPADSIWHVFTPPDVTETLRQTEAMHLPPNSGASLIQVPFVPWAAYFPALRPLLEQPSDQTARAAWLAPDERALCQAAWEKLTPRQQAVLAQIAMGRTRQQAADQLRVAPSTIDSHIKAIHAVCRAAWPEGAHIDSAFLRARFGPFLNLV